MHNLLKLSVVVDYSKERVAIDESSLVNFITVDNMLSNKAGITTAENLPPKGSSLPRYKPENILVGNIRPYLKKIWFANKEGGATSDVLIFNVKPGYFPKYVYYAMFRDDFFTHMMCGKKGTKMPRGDKDSILDFLIPDFEYPAQQNIAAVLSALDAKIEHNNFINTELEAMVKTLYDYWFVQFDFPNSKGKPYKTNGGKMIWNDKLKREIPEGWKAENLGVLGEFKNGINYDPSIKSKTKAKIINVRNISDSTWFISQFDLDTIFLEEVDVKNYLVTDKDILIARSGIPGATRIMYEYEENTIYCGFIIRYQVKDLDNKNHLFLSLKDLERSTTSKSAGTIMQNVNQDTLKRMFVVLPEKNLILNFNNLILPIFQELNKNLNENQQLCELRDWLLPMLMNGQVKVT